RFSSATSAPTRNLLMDPLCPLPTILPSATMAARVLVPPPSIPRTTLMISLPFQGRQGLKPLFKFAPPLRGCDPSYASYPGLRSLARTCPGLFSLPPYGRRAVRLPSTISPARRRHRATFPTECSGRHRFWAD